MGRSVWHRNVTGDEQLVSLHHIRWSAIRTARRVVLGVVVVSLGIAGMVAPAGARSDRSVIESIDSRNPPHRVMPS